jgi:hypothetical protein
MRGHALQEAHYDPQWAEAVFEAFDQEYREAGAEVRSAWGISRYIVAEWVASDQKAWRAYKHAVKVCERSVFVLRPPWKSRLNTREIT